MRTIMNKATTGKLYSSFDFSLYYDRLSHSSSHNKKKMKIRLFDHTGLKIFWMSWLSFTNLDWFQQDETRSFLRTTRLVLSVRPDSLQRERFFSNGVLLTTMKTWQSNENNYLLTYYLCTERQHQILMKPLSLRRLKHFYLQLAWREAPASEQICTEVPTRH